MSRYTLHVVWLLLSAAGVGVVYGGPLWAYVPAVLLALIAALFLTAIFAENPWRWALAALGSVMVVAATTHFVWEGFSQWTVNQAMFGLLLGLAFIWFAFFPLHVASEATSSDVVAKD